MRFQIACSANIKELQPCSPKDVIISIFISHSAVGSVEVPTQQMKHTQCSQTGVSCGCTWVVLGYVHPEDSCTLCACVFK